MYEYIYVFHLGFFGAENLLGPMSEKTFLVF